MTPNNLFTEPSSTVVTAPAIDVHQIVGPLGSGAASPKSLAVTQSPNIKQSRNNVTAFHHQTSEPAYLLFFLQSPSSLGELFWDHGEMGGALLNEDFSVHTDFGIVHSPCPNTDWKSGRLLAGNIVPGRVHADGRREFHLFYGGSPGGDGLLQEELGLAKFSIAPNGTFEWDDRQTVTIKGWEKYYDYSTHPEKPEIVHRQWRDPFVVHHDGLYWMFISAAAQTTSEIYKGCVGLVVSENVEGPYTAVRSPLFPNRFTANGEQGICYDCERSHVFHHNGMWHLFFSAREKLTHTHLLQGDGAPLTDSSLHHYQSPNIQGPYFPVSDRPIVEGSTATGLYGINFIRHTDGKVLAYGFDNEKMMLDVTGSWEVVWPEGRPMIQPNQPADSTAQIRNLLYKPGYQLWDATMLRL